MTENTLINEISRTMHGYPQLKFSSLFIILVLCISAIPLSFAEYIDHSDTWKFDPEKFFEYSFNNNRPVPDIEKQCPQSFGNFVGATFVYLNHTITNGTLGKMCTFHYSNLFFELDAVDDGELILDIPKDVFVSDEIGFFVDVYSTKYVTWEDKDYVDRVYIPKNISASVFELVGESITPRNKHLQITLIDSNDSFNRFKIPFLKDDIYFKFQYDIVRSNSNIKYNPEKYNTPIPEMSNCDKSIGVYEFEKINVIDYDISTGEFIDFCTNDEYNFFEVYLSALEGGTLTIEIPKSKLPHFDYHDCVVNEFTINYEEKPNPNIIVNQIFTTNTTRTLQIQWDDPVSIISYFRNTNHCIDTYVENNYDPNKSIPKQESNKKEIIESMDEICNHDFVSEIYLNHTITNGKLKRICSGSYGNLVFEIESTNDGYLILDIPKDVFTPSYTNTSGDWSFNAYVDSPHTNNDKDNLYTRYFYNEEYLNSVYESNKDDYPIKSEFFKSWLGIDYTNKHLQISLIESFENFDRYKFPFLKDDVVFNLGFVETMREPNVFYNPEKYTVPIQDQTHSFTKFVNDEFVKMMSIYCSKEGITPIHLNYTIHNGELHKICSYGYNAFTFEIDSFNDGYLILDVPKDIFNPHNQYEFNAYVNYAFNSGNNLFEYTRYSEKYIESYMETYDDTLHRNKDLDISLIESFENFDRYKFPFQKHDKIFNVGFYAHPYNYNTIYSPQKYTNPDNQIVKVLDQKNKLKEKPQIKLTEKLSLKEQIQSKISIDKIQCSENKVLMKKMMNDSMICVTENSAEKLINRGYAT